MSYTNADLVRVHLGPKVASRDRIVDVPGILTAGEYVSFHTGPIDPASVIVKARTTRRPQRQSLTFVSGKAAIGTAPLVSGSVVLASDSSLGYVYTENVDYIVNHSQGELAVLDDSAIDPGGVATVWYEAYTVFTEGADYQLDASKAAIRRLATGAIADGQQVLVDFAPLDRQLDDTMVASAVNEANATVERTIDPDQQYGADPTLQAAATYRALEIVCRSSAVRELSRHFADDRIATTWIKLSDEFSRRSTELLRSFGKPYSGPVTVGKS